MAKAVDIKAAKAAKQKIVIVGGVLLVLLLAWQVPRTMKMMNKSGPPASAQPTTTTPTTATTPQPTTGAEPSTTAPPISSSSPVSLVLTAPLAPAAGEGQLDRLTPTFTAKDPFSPQLEEELGPGAAQPAAATPAAKALASPSLKVVPNAAVSTPKPNAPSAPATAPTKAPAAPAAAAQPRISAVISVNGIPEGVNLDADFPAASPFFHLVSLTAKTAKISVAGGSLASGNPTLTLQRGKAVTLVNTADGTRYRLLLVSTSTTSAAAPAATTTPTTPAG